MVTKAEKKIINRNIQLTHIEEKGNKTVEIKFEDDSAVKMKQMGWWFAYQTHIRLCKRYGIDVQKWPKYLWK